MLTSLLFSASAVLKSKNEVSINQCHNLSKLENENNELTINQDNFPNQPTDTKTGFLSIPSAAFVPKDDSIKYEINSLYIKGNGRFFAPVYLPNGVNITKLTFYWIDHSELNDGELRLWRSAMEGSYSEAIARVYTSGSEGWRKSSCDDEIVLGEIDNSKYSYLLELKLESEIYSYNIQIEYIFNTKVFTNAEDMATYNSDFQKSNDQNLE
jgi:hypothetical protein